MSGRPLIVSHTSLTDVPVFSSSCERSLSSSDPDVTVVDRCATLESKRVESCWCQFSRGFPHHSIRLRSTDGSTLCMGKTFGRGAIPPKQHLRTVVRGRAHSVSSGCPDTRSDLFLGRRLSATCSEICPCLQRTSEIRWGRMPNHSQCVSGGGDNGVSAQGQPEGGVRCAIERCVSLQTLCKCFVELSR